MTFHGQRSSTYGLIANYGDTCLVDNVGLVRYEGRNYETGSDMRDWALLLRFEDFTEIVDWVVKDQIRKGLTMSGKYLTGIDVNKDLDFMEKWYNDLDSITRGICEEAAIKVAERYVPLAIPFPPNITIPKHWIIPNFHKKVLELIEKDNINIQHVYEDDNKLIIKRVESDKSLILLVLRSDWAIGRNMIAHRLGNTFKAVEGRLSSNTEPYKNTVAQAFRDGLNVAIRIDYDDYSTVNNIRDICKKHNAQIIYADIHGGV
jgi:hypothetical protein